MNPPLELGFALQCAQRLIGWLGPFVCEIEVAGSIRRRRPRVGDIDLVVIPVVREHRNLLGEVERTDNLTAAEIRFDSRVEGMKFARQVQLTCQQVGEWPVKQYRRRNRIPSTLWPEPVLRSCLSMLPPPAQPALPLD